MLPAHDCKGTLLHAQQEPFGAPSGKSELTWTPHERWRGTSRLCVGPAPLGSPRTRQLQAGRLSTRSTVFCTAANHPASLSCRCLASSQHALGLDQEPSLDCFRPSICMRKWQHLIGRATASKLVITTIDLIHMSSVSTHSHTQWQHHTRSLPGAIQWRRLSG